MNPSLPLRALIALLFLLFFQVHGQSLSGSKGTKEDPYVVPRINATVEIDGNITESVWREALQLNLPFETYPAENVAAPVHTDAFLFYDENQLYVAFRAHDPRPDRIRAHYIDRDQIWHEDFVMIALDTFNDERRAFCFRCNPLGVQSDDIRLPNEHSINWDAIYDSKGQITDSGYEVEMAIPFDQLYFQRTNDEQIWGLNLRRLYPRDVMHTLDAIKIDRNNDSVISQFLKIRGFSGADPGTNIEAIPTAIVNRLDERDEMPDGSLKRQYEKREFGLTTHWGFTPNMTLSGTYNPDFSQVEADALQMDINEPFALSFSEKRPFFMENSDFFRSLKQAVYTRTIRDPLWGFKLTGKEGSHTVAAYMARDEFTNLIFPGSQRSSSSSRTFDNTSTVLRYKSDLGQNYTLGAMFTDREGENYYNRLAGLDANLRLTNSDRIQLQVMGSSTKYPQDIATDFAQKSSEFKDHFIAFEYDHETRDIGWWLDYDQVGRDFRADLGFIPMVDFRNVEGGVHYRWTGDPGGWWSEFHIGNELSYYEDGNREVLLRRASIWASYQGAMQSHASFQVTVRQEGYNERFFDLQRFNGCVGLWPTSESFVHVSYAFGDQIDYTNTRLGNRIRLTPYGELSLGRHLRLNFEHTFERLTVNSNRLYSANISILGAVYHINVRTFFRTLLQYVDYNRNVDNYLVDVDPRFQQFLTQFLFSYKINPFTVLFIGYSDNYLGTKEYDLTQQNRTLFAKISYALTM
jgi:hypothetical protein